MDWTLAVGSLSFGIFDFIVFGAILIGGVTGAALGFSRSACKTMGIILCFPCAMLFVEPFSAFLLSKINMPTILAALASFIVLSAFIYILFRILGNLIGNTFETLGLGAVDTVLGFLWGVIIAVSVVFLLLQIISLQHFIDFMPLKENSVIYCQIFCKIFPIVGKTFKEALLETI